MFLEQNSCRDVCHILDEEFHFLDVVDVVEAEVDIWSVHLYGGTDEIRSDVELEEVAVFDFDDVRCLFILARFIGAHSYIDLLFFALSQSVLLEIKAKWRSKLP